MLVFPLKSESQRGDTIVEVLICLAVLGAVLGGAYVASSKSSTANQSAQERLEAVKLAETQFERLRAEAAANPSVLSKNNFCLPASIATCIFAGDGTTATAEDMPQYSVLVERVAPYPLVLPGVPDAGTRFKVNISWDNVSGDHTDSLEFFYEVYR